MYELNPKQAAPLSLSISDVRSQGRPQRAPSWRPHQSPQHSLSQVSHNPGSGQRMKKRHSWHNGLNEDLPFSSARQSHLHVDLRGTAWFTAYPPAAPLLRMLPFSRRYPTTKLSLQVTIRNQRLNTSQDSCTLFLFFLTDLSDLESGPKSTDSALDPERL